MTAPIVKVMVANKLPATVLAQVFLLVIAGFAVSLYILPTATGTANGILSFHTSNIPCLRCFLFARRLSAYILGHHRIFIPSADERRLNREAEIRRQNRLKSRAVFEELCNHSTQ